MINRCTFIAFICSLSLVNTSTALAQNDDPINCEINPAQNEEHCSEGSDEILIITQRKSPLAGLSPTSQATTQIAPSESIAIPTTLTDLIEGTPGVAENSQPGLFQVVSIRGVSRQRILTLVEGVKIANDRRAGVAASFIDPLLLSNVEITRGPISSYYGSGAIGGVSNLNFTRTQGITAAAGIEQSGNQNYQMFGYGKDSASVAVVHRQSDNSEDIAGNPLNTHFEQTSGLLQKAWSKGSTHIDHWLFASKGNDLGRSNSRFPERVVDIPDEQHLIFKTAISNENQWSLDFATHDQSITTNTLRPQESLASVTNSSLDTAISWQTAWEFPQESILVGIDFDARRRVSVEEKNTDFSANLTSYANTLNDGESDEIAGFYAHHLNLQDYRLQYGGRFTYQKNGQPGNQSASDNAFTAFAGLAYKISDKWELSANFGNSFRFASLTERFFSGTTARGNIQGNPNLKPERATTFDFGVEWKIRDKRFLASIFKTHFKDYIDRVETAPEQLTFVNKEDGVIEGVEGEYHWDISQQLEFDLVATFINGKNTDREPISDIPSDRLGVALNYHLEQITTKLGIQHRFKKSNAGSGELVTQAATIAEFSISYRPNHQWQVSLFAKNLFDEQYVSSADDLATLAEGRNFGINVQWHK
jgi:outer membrane receptor protein involved in Fe transport